jgi:hypothetical protein
VELLVELENLLASLGDLEENIVLVFSFFFVDARRTRHIFCGTQLTGQRFGNAQALPIEHNNSLPIVQFKEVNFKINSGVLLTRSGLLPFPQSPVNIFSPQSEIRVKVGKERRG